MSHRNAMIASVAFAMILLVGIITLRNHLTTSADPAPVTGSLTTAVPTGVAVAGSGELVATPDALPSEAFAWTDDDEDDEHDDDEHDDDDDDEHHSAYSATSGEATSLRGDDEHDDEDDDD